MSKSSKEIGPSPNIAYVGEPGGELPYINNSLDGKINLPDAQVQKKPFYHENANTIIQLFPMLYKKVVEKG